MSRTLIFYTTIAAAGLTGAPKCYELAEHFLQGTARNTHENRDLLAKYIQTAIEDFFASEFED